jgi:quinol monooxygenase YgiN
MDLIFRRIYGNNMIISLEAKEGKIEELLEFGKGVRADISAAEGATSFRLLRDMQNPRKVLFVEEWESRDAHERHMKKIFDSGVLDEALPIMEGKPQGSYYEEH